MCAFILPPQASIPAFELTLGVIVQWYSELINSLEKIACLLFHASAFSLSTGLKIAR